MRKNGTHTDDLYQFGTKDMKGKDRHKGGKREPLFYRRLRERMNTYLFECGDVVSFTSSRGHLYVGKVVEVVKAGRYPYTQVRTRGFFRTIPSYVILLDERFGKWQYRYPHACTLRLVRRDNVTYRSAKRGRLTCVPSTPGDK